MESLHEHNQKTYENICRMYDEGIQRVAVVQPTGSGKSLLMAKLIEDNPNSRFFVLSTRHEINDQFKEKLDEEMLKRSDFNIYWNMPNMKQEVMESLQPDYILLDEMHRALAKEWSKGIKVLLEMYPNAKVLGLSATPIRYLDKCRNVAEELFNGNLACDMSLSQAILDGILPMARYVCGVYSYEKDTESLNKKIERSCNSEEEKKELLKELKILKENLDKGHGVSDIFRKYIMTGNEKLVVFLKNTKHLGIMKPVIEKWFLDAGFNVRLYEVHSKNTDKDKEFQAFREDKEEGIIKACLSVNMITEGIHGDIDGVIMLRNTISANMYFQMIGRAFACGKKTIPLIIDLVANSQFISDAANLSFPSELRGEIEKRKKECEKEGKEYDPGFDVDEFIVMDEFMDVISGFRAIEGRLEGNWDKKVDKCIDFYNITGRLPNKKSENLEEKILAYFLINCKSQLKNNLYYSNYKKQRLREIPTFLEHTNKTLNRFCKCLKEIKKSGRNIDVTSRYIENDYKIGQDYMVLRKQYKNGELNSREIDKIKECGVDITLNRNEREFKNKIRLVQEAISNGEVITRLNPKFKNVDLYNWYRRNKNSFTEEELRNVNQVICNSKKKSIKIIDITTGNTFIFSSINEAGMCLYNKFNVAKSKSSGVSIIQNRLVGNTKNPIYKDRFRFEYVEDKVDDF